MSFNTSLIYFKLEVDAHVLILIASCSPLTANYRDFAAKGLPNSVEACSPNIAAIYVGGYQFSWRLGIPFLKRFVSSPFV